MGLFDKKPKAEPEILLADFEDVANYESALNFLVGLSDDEYNKVVQVAAIHRKAYQEAAAVLGTANEPSTFIKPPEPADMLAEDDELATAFLDDEPKSEPKKVEVK